MALLLGWQFTLAEFVGGPLMILFLAVAFRVFVRRRVVEAARAQADQGLAGSMEGHAGMDMSVPDTGSLWSRLASPAGFNSTAGYFVMDWAAVYKDIIGGLLLAGAFEAWVPQRWLQVVFLADHPLAAQLWGPLIGPALAMVSFVCSIGNVPLAGVLWNGGLSFGGVVSFIFADLIIIPILLIYRKYYGTAMALRIFAIFYATMALAGYVIELVFTPLGLVPATRNAQVMASHLSWNYTTWLNIAFLVLAAALVWRFVRTGQLPMLRAMGGNPDPPHDHAEHGTEAHGDGSHPHPRAVESPEPGDPPSRGYVPAGRPTPEGTCSEPFRGLPVERRPVARTPGPRGAASVAASGAGRGGCAGRAGGPGGVRRPPTGGPGLQPGGAEFAAGGPVRRCAGPPGCPGPRLHPDRPPGAGRPRRGYGADLDLRHRHRAGPAVTRHHRRPAAGGAGQSAAGRQSGRCSVRDQRALARAGDPQRHGRRPRRHPTLDRPGHHGQRTTSRCPGRAATGTTPTTGCNATAA